MSDRAVQGASLENWCVIKHRGFESHLIHSLIAQLVERLAVNQNVVCSNHTQRDYWA